MVCMKAVTGGQNGVLGIVSCCGPDSLQSGVLGIVSCCGPDSLESGVLGIVSCCGPDSLEIESQWGRDIPGLSRPAPKPTQTPVKWVLGLYQD